MKDTKMKKGQKISEEQRLDILKDYNSGMNAYDRTMKYKVSTQRQNQILHELEALGYKVFWRK
jgi:Mor family transcriptional regulator